MVDFGNDYWSSGKKRLENVDISARDIGISMGIGDPWTSIKTAVTAGASHVELGFMGMQKGSLSSPTSVTPEIIGKSKREDIRQFAKVNKVTLSTHATANVMGFAGMRENRFDEAAAAQSVYEVKRAIDFAADTAEGGPVVIHTGEFPRPICEAGKDFLAHKDEQKKAMWGLVDKNGQMKAMLSRDYTVPVVDWVEKNGIKEPAKDEKGNYLYKNMSYDEFVEEAKKTGEKPEKLFFSKFMEKERLRASAEKKRWETMADEYKKQYEMVKNMQDSVADLAKKDKEAADYAAMRYAEQVHVAPPKEDAKEYRKFLNNPQEFLGKATDKIKKEISYAYENSAAAGRQEREVELEIGNEEKGIKGSIKTLKDFALEKSASNIAELGMYAYQVEKDKKLKKAMFIAPENVFPEQYGSHPQELREIIIQSRAEMVKKLVAKKVSEDEATKIAAEHIKATFDIGHANTWKKYFQGSDKEFKEWFIKQSRQLLQEGIIGHVHIADNFGYYDEHLTPGEGNVPIEEFMKEVVKAGLKDKMIVEPGAQGEGESIYGSMFGAWAKVASSPIYRIGNVDRNWTDVSGSYFGQTHTPRYITGGYLINPKSEEDNWWSGTPIE
ncbi:MAG: TIM barrel protein [Nanoarchaeota archaeon]|nr:TIM barrel protein [Nanoarchaeota archaeon]